jgi:hypothetical protein
MPIQSGDLPRRIAQSRPLKRSQGELADADANTHADDAAD